jgi:hypothetical protein
MAQPTASVAQSAAPRALSALLLTPTAFRLDALPLTSLLRRYRGELIAAVESGDVRTQDRLLPAVRDLEVALEAALANPDWVTPTRYAAVWDVDEESVRRWCRDQRITSELRGGRWRVDVAQAPPPRRSRTRALMEEVHRG